MRSAVLVGTAVILVTGCTSAGESLSTTTFPSIECSQPPPEALLAESEFDVELSPNPVEAGSEATLSVEYDEKIPGLGGGVGASWECWSEGRWVATHNLVRGVNGYGPSVIDLSDPTREVSDLGLRIPNSYAVLIPDVASGTYRIVDGLYGFQMSLVGFEIVEVLSP